MSVEDIFRCNICSEKGIETGVTLRFSYIKEGLSALDDPVAFKGLHTFHDYPQVIHICPSCFEVIKQPQEHYKASE